ncbi:MAG: TonB-dependent receptor [Acidobacteriota bacterium]
MRFERASAVVLFSVWVMAARAAAQAPSPTGNLYGTALDAQGHSVIGVTVALTGSGAVQTAQTGANGDFHFLNLSPGAYAVRLDRTGFETVRRDVTVVLGKSSVISITMPVAGAVEDVTVHGDAPALDNRKIQTGATFGQKELESIPTTRDPWAILRQVPGVLIETVNVGGNPHARQPLFVGKGAHPDQNSYNLDGVAISLGGISPLFFDFDSLSDIEVATGGSDPSLATPGVTINLVTKRGTNRLKGSARVLYTGGAGWDFGIEAGGSPWKDHLWVWGAAARNSYLGHTFFSNTGEAVRSQETLEHWNAKLNAQLLPDNALALTYTDFKRLNLGLASPDFSRASTGDNVRPGKSYRVEDSQVLSARLFASLYVSYVTAVSTAKPEGGIDEQAEQDIDLIWQRSYWSRRFRDSQQSTGTSASAFFDTGGLRHELKFGFGFRHTRSDEALSWPGDGLVGYAFYRQVGITRRQDQKSEVNHYFAFFGDTVQAGNLTLNFGARFDYQQGRNLAASVPANPVFPELLPAVQYDGDSNYPITRRQIQPRVGATYALGRHRTLLRASYSRFADQLSSTPVRFISAFPDIAALYYSWNDANGNDRVERDEVNLSDPQGFVGVDPNDPGSSASVNRIASGFEPPVTDEYILQVERQIASDLSGSVSYTYRKSRNPLFFDLIGTSADSYRYLGNATGTFTDGAGFVVNFSEPYYGLTDPPPVGTELRNRPDANETYEGVELQLLKSFSHGWMARLSASFNDWRQHVGPRAIFNPNNETPGTNANGPTGEGVINSKWQFNVSGMVALPLGIEAGLNLFGRQGFSIPYWVEVVTGDSNFNRPGIQIGQATRYRAPDLYDLDLQIAKVFRIGSLTVTPQIACFNLLDSRTVLQRDGFVGTYDPQETPDFRKNESFNAPIEALSKRVFRGGVRIEF